jgi:hypothetical protein
MAKIEQMEKSHGYATTAVFEKHLKSVEESSAAAGEQKSISKYKSKRHHPKTNFPKTDIPKKHHVYAIVLSIDPFDLEDCSTQWQFCQIGVTDIGTKEQLQQTIDRKYGEGKARVLFVLPINPIDFPNPQNVKDSIRDIFGYRVPPERVKHLPEPNDWVITTLDFIQAIKNRIANMRENDDHTALFDEVFTFPQENYPRPAALDAPNSSDEEDSGAHAHGTGDQATQELSDSLGNMSMDD